MLETQYSAHRDASKLKRQDFQERAYTSSTVITTQPEPLHHDLGDGIRLRSTPVKKRKNPKRNQTPFELIHSDVAPPHTFGVRESPLITRRDSAIGRQAMVPMYHTVPIGGDGHTARNLFPELDLGLPREEAFMPAASLDFLRDNWNTPPASSCGGTGNQSPVTNQPMSGNFYPTCPSASEMSEINYSSNLYSDV